MKLHDLRPAPGSTRPRTRVGRGIAAGKGKTAGRGTKGQLARHNALPAFFEGGQTPLHVRIPKLRGFRNRFKTEYEVVNLGRIAQAIDEGRLEAEPVKGRGAAGPITVNQEILRAVGLVRRLDLPLKVLGQGEVSSPLFVVADAFSKSARAKIEAAGGTVQVLEIPTGPTAAIMPDGAPAPAAEAEARTSTKAEPAAADTPTPASTRRAPRAAAPAATTESAPEGQSESPAEAADEPGA
jgi:large subunit ribosomal protein L15